ncbi:hypothetical protein GLOIN_2v1771749 [Rhizophagus irregularis DAOM 181602=DAOM 197198]|uniref:Uncharacterized protein n=1 Tax=Rhizophagus irregularis (strain DAOM 181602 / DAOM 197198 / MUCL 43194) TaxID=747089 RepID=A0A2P4Q917_RHIID|nr:hypothetical protein GLOIN_2v1771749 [Rhizophagus irregularis DAOM 181602=DAOM 197198]POG74135.1 hypothetical protein GLOIN_2v1771749 [Rhizophagus irregularis DAOM 181602=DAOM 197198]|eukprot:XP_025181001.1 hypothetical protein GLOIN_2v1771749 [Rhizophagus irregularis DAOM 181602=DAOM 197198]
MLTLDVKNLLTHKELFYKRFIKKRLIRTNTIKNRWFKLEAELIDNILINRKIKNDIFEKIKTTYSSNLKVLYGKVVGMEGSLVNIAHYIVLSEPEDFNIVFNKCILRIIQIPDRYLADDIRTAIEDDDIGVEDQNINKKFVMGEKCDNNLSLEKLLMINNKVKENSSNGKKIHIYMMDR